MKKVFPILILVFSLSCVAFAANCPQRIISLGPSITEQLYLLRAEDRLVGCTVYCNKPPRAKEKEKVGTVVEVNLEKIVSLKPDLVLATPLTNRKAIEKLKNLGIAVVVFPAAKTFIQICSQFLELGKFTGKEKQAEEIAKRVKSKAVTIKNAIENLRKPKVFIQIGAKPLFAATGASFVNDFIEFAGGINIAKEAKTGIYSREQVLMKNPDVIIIATMGIAGEKEKGVWKRYKSLKAVEKNRIYIIDSYKLCSPTPISFVETLKELVIILHPEKAKSK